MTPLRIGKAALLLAVLLPLPLFAQDQEARISVTVSPNPVSERETVQLQIAVDAPLVDSVSSPNFDSPDLTVMGTPEMKFQPENSDFGPNTRKKQTFTYVLMPKRTGEFVIRNIQAKVGGRSLSSPDVRIKVTADSSAPSRPAPLPPSDDEESNPASPAYSGNPFTGSQPTQPTPSPRGKMSVPDRFNSDFTLWASPNKTHAYVGEPIVVEYYLYDFGGVRQIDVLKWPTFEGFWKEDLEIVTRPEFEDAFVKQQEMRRAFIARYALYGIKPGRIAVDKLGIMGKYVSNDWGNQGPMFGFDLRTGQHYSQDLSLEILPLPTAGRPEKFSGAVGKFALKLEADKLSLPQNTPVTFTLTLTGTGNFQAIDTIKIPLPPDFELYESVANGRNAAPIGVHQELDSKKSFQLTAIPRKAGKFEVAPVTWSFFNTEKETYETLTTSPLSIEVLPNNNSTDSASNTYLGPRDPKSGEPTPPPESLRNLKPISLEAKSNTFSYLNWAIVAALLVNAFLAFRFLKGRSRGIYKLVKGMDRFAEARIRLLQAKGIRDAEWQAGLEEVLLTTVQVLLDTNPRGLTKNDLEELWKARSLPTPLFQRVSALLEELDRNRFSSNKLTGSGTQELRSRLTKETENLLSEASRAKRK